MFELKINLVISGSVSPITGPASLLLQLYSYRLKTSSRKESISEKYIGPKKAYRRLSMQIRRPASHGHQPSSCPAGLPL